MTEQTISQKREDTRFFGHPKGLAYIVFTETWERFSFYGMQALLVLYMSTHLFKPETADKVIGLSKFRDVVESVFGELSLTAFSTQAFGLYVGLVYFMPVFGGLIGDRLIGRKKAVIIGAVLMALGHFLMAIESLFLFALLALILGSGFLKGNLAAQVGFLYKKEDPRRDSGFSIYVLGINLGAAIAPLVCGTLGELYGWHLGFGAAGIGMLIALAIYVAGYKYMPADEVVESTKGSKKLVKGEGKIIVAILLFLSITALFWTAQTQVWNTYPLWIKDHVARGIGGFTIPVTWFQSLDMLAVLLMAPIVLMFWRKQARKKTEPSDLVKVGLGCAVFSIACVWLSVGELMSDGQVGLFWPVVFHFICGWAFLYVGPIALALTSRAAPVAVNSMMVGTYYLAIFFGSVFSGWLGRFYEQISPEMFWLIHAAIVGFAALCVIGLRRPLATAMKLGIKT